MAHYDEDVHCKICGEYLGTYNMLYDPDPPKDQECPDEDNCKKRKKGEIKTRYW